MTPGLYACAVIGSLVLLSACSGDSTVTTLDANPEVSIPVPRFLLDEEFLTQDNLRPIVSLSNGDVLSVNLVGAERWSGTITVETGEVYNLTVRWVENFNGTDLPLAERVQDLAVGNDGSVELIDADDTGEASYDTSFDFDSDGQSNFAERREGTDPLASNASADEQNVANVIVPRISSMEAPGIDGQAAILEGQAPLAGEWSSAVQSDMSGASLAIGNLQESLVNAENDATSLRRWAAMHDGNYLYLLAWVNAETDPLELFLNVGYGQPLSSELTERHHIVPFEANNTLNDSSDARKPSASQAQFEPDANPIVVASGFGQAEDGLQIYELKLDLQAADINTDTPFGIELQIDKDATEPSRRFAGTVLLE